VPDLRSLLTDRLLTALGELGVEGDPLLRRSERADFQADGLLGAARRLGRSPRELAAEVAERADLGDLCRRVEVAGPGFLNLWVRPEALAAAISRMAADPRLGVAPLAPEVVVVDYSAPNVAKEMHVGHLRSTIIGDCLVRLLDFGGQKVVRQNHIGDWGTPFGMLIERLVDLGIRDPSAPSLADLGAFYREARAAFDTDPAFAERARRRVVALQAKEPETLALWQVLRDASARYFDEVYHLLGVTLRPEDLAGESSYNDDLPHVVEELAAAGLLVESEGALCVFPPGFVGRDGSPQPLIVRKADGGFGYAATDLAAIRHRVIDLGARQILYVVGAPQRTHLEMVFAVARMAGWLGETVCEHVSFGSVLGADGRILRTRAGDAVRLVDLLEEAIERADAIVAAKSPDLAAEERAAVARAVGIGAVKYADLVNDRVRDYRFDWDRMLAFDGNTAPYLQYAHARIRSIFRRAGLEEGRQPEGDLALGDEAELALALALEGFPAAVAEATARRQPHRLAGYLYDLAGAFTGFYESCPVLQADEAVRTSRLRLAWVTAEVLSTGLYLLGIEAPARL